MTTTSSPAPAAKPMLFYGILVAVSTAGPLAMNLFVPFIPGLMDEFATSSGAVQLTLTFYLAGIAISQLFYGPLSDRFGRRPAMLVGLTLYICASLLCAVATSIETLMAARFVQALGGASGMVLARAIVRDIHGREASASVLGYITMAWVLVPMFAPALGGFIDQFSTWRMAFYILSVIGAIILAMTIRWLPETNPAGGDDGTRLGSGMAALVREPKFIGHTLTLGFCSSVFFSFIAGAPYIMINVLDQTPLDYGLWFMMISVGYMTGNFVSGRYSQRFGIDRMITTGNVLSMIGASAMLAFGVMGSLTPLTLFGPMLLVTLGNGLTIPNATAAAISVLPRTIGAAAGLSGFTQMAIGASASQFTGTLQQATPLIALWIMAVSAVLAFGVSFFTKQSGSGL